MQFEESGNRSVCEIDHYENIAGFGAAFDLKNLCSSNNHIAVPTFPLSGAPSFAQSLRMAPAAADVSVTR